MEFLNEHGAAILSGYATGIFMTLFLCDWPIEDAALWPLTILRKWWRK